MRVDPTDAATMEAPRLDQIQDFLMRGDVRLREVREQLENLTPVLEASAREFSDDERVAVHHVIDEQSLQARTSDSKVIDPDRSVGEDHAALLDLRRRVGRRPRSVPPSSARRRALSRAINASRPSLTKDAFSVMPVRRAAFRMRSSSMFRLVFMVRGSMRAPRGAVHFAD